MRPGLFAVGENRSSNATQTGLTQNDDVIQALSSNRSDQSLEMGVLPRTIPSVYRIWYTPSVGKNPKLSTGTATQPEALERQGKRVPAIFFRTEAGGEPGRDWLKKGPLSSRPETHRGGHQDRGVWLANRDARLQALRRWHL